MNLLGTANYSDILGTVVSSIVGMIAIIVIIRINGLRSLSKMSSYDFIVTIATGSIVGSVAIRAVDFIIGATALATIFFLQFVISKLRYRYSFARMVDNSPVMLMEDGEFCHEAMKKSTVTKQDIVAKLREATICGLRVSIL